MIRLNFNYDIRLIIIIQIIKQMVVYGGIILCTYTIYKKWKLKHFSW